MNPPVEPSGAPLVDIGANLTHKSFRGDIEAVLARARGVGVRHLVVTGTSLPGSERARELAHEHAELRATAGIHPHNAKECDAAAIDRLRELCATPHVVAVGECGLDYDRNFSTPQQQRGAFEAQLAIAADTGLPVFLHERCAHDDFTAILRNACGTLSDCVVHCFTSGPAERDVYLELGAYIGVTGWVCDERRGAALRAAVPGIPGDRLLIETDAPFLLPRDLKPKPASRRNEPMHLAHVARRLAALRREDVGDLARTTTRNADRFFGLTERAGDC